MEDLILFSSALKFLLDSFDAGTYGNGNSYFFIDMAIFFVCEGNL